jgi:excisionase family DNA binding protein
MQKRDTPGGFYTVATTATARRSSRLVVPMPFWRRPTNEEGNERRGPVNGRRTETTDDALLTPSEVAAMFRVNPKTVTRWARAGKISAIRTLGGHRRFRASEIQRFLAQVEEHQET